MIWGFYCNNYEKIMVFWVVGSCQLDRPGVSKKTSYPSSGSNSKPSNKSAEADNKFSLNYAALQFRRWYN
jgi:hypothetical protein